jgi:hypothetical protein
MLERVGRRAWSKSPVRNLICCQFGKSRFVLNRTESLILVELSYNRQLLMSKHSKKREFVSHYYLAL